MSFWNNNAQRQEALRNVAHELGMSFTEKDDYGTIALLRDFHIFKKGGNKRIVNLMEKKSGLLDEKISIMDYHYTVSTGKSVHNFQQTIFFIQSKRLALPEMLLKPETFFHKIGAWLGMQDIDFEEHKKFSDGNLLQGPDEVRIRETMGKEAIFRFFTLEKEWSMESVGYYLILYKQNQYATPDAIRWFYKKGMELYDLLKLQGE